MQPVRIDVIVGEDEHRFAGDEAASRTRGSFKLTVELKVPSWRNSKLLSLCKPQIVQKYISSLTCLSLPISSALTEDALGVISLWNKNCSLIQLTSGPTALAPL